MALLVDPLECKKCENAFCKKCLDDWLKKHPNECPNRCQPISAGPLHRVLRTVLDKLRVKCPNTQCEYTDSYSKIFKHIKSCEFSSASIK